MRILLLQNIGSRYGVLSQMTTDLCSAFIRQGVEANVFDAWDQGPEHLYRFIKDWKPDFTFGINLFAHNQLPFETYSTEHICLCVDALNHYEEVSDKKINLPHTIVLFIDESSSNLYEKRNGHSFWLPHAISEELLDTIKTENLLPRADRKFEAVLLGSYIDPDQELRLWKDYFLPKEVDSLSQLVEELLENETLSVQHETINFLKQNPSLTNVLKKKSFPLSKFISSVELYMRGLDRKRLLEAFREEPVHVFGEGWPSCSPHVVHPPIPFTSVFDICAQAKVVLNSTPMIRRGYHERLFLGLASGALVVTSKINMPDVFDTKTLIPYTTSSLSTLQAQINRIKESPPPLKYLQENHTWDIRVKQLIPKLEEHRIMKKQTLR